MRAAVWTILACLGAGGVSQGREADTPKAFGYRCVCQSPPAEGDCNGNVTFAFTVEGETLTVGGDREPLRTVENDPGYAPRKNFDYVRYRNQGRDRGILIQSSLVTGGELLVEDVAGKKAYGGFAQIPGTERASPALYLCSTQRR